MPGSSGREEAIGAQVARAYRPAAKKALRLDPQTLDLRREPDKRLGGLLQGQGVNFIRQGSETATVARWPARSFSLMSSAEGITEP